LCAARAGLGCEAGFDAVVASAIFLEAMTVKDTMNCPACGREIEVKWQGDAPVKGSWPKTCPGCDTSLKMMVSNADQSSIFYLEKRTADVI
jgi:hypothetical protein